MNYIGSKHKLSAFLYQNIQSALEQARVKPLEDCIFCDMFAGSGSVGRLFKPKVKQIIANDKEYYSFVLNQNYIANCAPFEGVAEFFEELVSDEVTPPIEGKIYRHYCIGDERFGSVDSGVKQDHKRQYFSDYNGAKIDAVRQKIEQYRAQGRITLAMYYHLLASLLESADKVANTASVYGAFLKKLKPSACKPLEFKPAFFTCVSESHQVFNTDANKLIGEIKGDILYLDPPYNAREYGANYHLLNSIAYYDDFIPKGKTGLRPYAKSAYCKKSEVAQALDDLIAQADFEWIFLSYNDEGLLDIEHIRAICEKYGRYSFTTQTHQRFKADSARMQRRNRTVEYLHILHKG